MSDHDARPSDLTRIRMDEMPWTAFRDRVSSGAVVIVPIGATEQHGHHLPLGVDAFIAAAIATLAAERVDGIVAPTLAYGYRSQPRTGGGTSFPGTTSLDGHTLALAVRDVVRELASGGARRIAILDGHFENEMFLTDAMELALREFRRDALDARVVKLRYFEELDEETIAQLWPDGYPGMALEHAALMETSMMLHLRPDLVHVNLAPADDPASFPPYDVYPSDPSWVPASGALSSPARASAAYGARLVKVFTDLVVRAIEDGLH
jgi:creatinine amidohydrolase